MNSWQYRYDTGWVACSDWTNQHLGTSLGGNVTHNLNTTLDNLLVKVYYSATGTDSDAQEVGPAGYTTRGFRVMYVDANNVKVQTGTDGIIVYDDSGVATLIDTESDYYRVKVWYLG